MRRSLLGLLAVCALAACAPTTEALTGCDDGRCDALGGVAALDGRGDAIAAWLRKAEGPSPEIVDCESGRCATAAGDFERIWTEIGRAQGCGAETLKTYVVSDDVLTAGAPFPRVIGVTCDDDVEGKGADVFIAAPFANEASTDIDVRRLEMFAWDAEAQRYNFYATRGTDDGKLAVEVEPQRCQSCHMAPADLDPSRTHMMAIMNELTLPWPHWSAQPDFPSRDFEVPAAIQNGPRYRALTSDDRLASASRFEHLIRRNAFERVARARAMDRNLAPSVEIALGLYKPLFCEEQVNYASEDGNQISASVLFDAEGLRPLFQALGESMPWQWAGEPSVVSLADQAPGAAEAMMVPIRGRSDITLESRLVALRVLSAEDVIRIHALDWKHPIFSQLRCGLWQRAHARLAGLETFGATTMAELMPKVYAEIMQIDGRSLVSQDRSRVLAVADATATPVSADLLTGATRDCTSGVCLLKPAELGDLLEAEVLAYERGNARGGIIGLRGPRVAHVLEKVADGHFKFVQRFGAAPSLPDWTR